MPNSGCCAPFCRCRGASAAVTSSWRTRAVARWRCSSAASTCWCRACARSWGTIRASHGSSRPCGGPATCSMCATCRAAWAGSPEPDPPDSHAMFTLVFQPFLQPSRWRARLRRCLPASLFGRLAWVMVGMAVVGQLLLGPLLLALHAWVFDLEGPGPWVTAPLSWQGGLEWALGLLAAVLAAWVGARCCAAPIERLVLAARAMGQGLERPPLPEDGSTEFREASRVFNQLQTTLQQRLQERDRVVASVSHDLRTPLTRLRLRAVAAPEPPVWTDIKALVDSLADDQQACGHWVPVHGRAGALLVQPLALRRCLGNLLSNAVRYGVQAEVFLWDDGREVGIEVRDHGPGLPEAELEHVLQPFVRLEAAAQRYRGGMGLGLSIARDIALRHQGQLQLRNRPEGGLMAVVRLPRQGVPPARVT